MKLKELIDRLNIFYAQYGDVEVSFDFKTGGEYLYTYYDADNEIIHEYDINERLHSIFIEEIIDIAETTYADGEVVGVCLSNYVQGDEDEG